MIQATKTMKKTVWALLLAMGLAAPAGALAATPGEINGLARNVERAEAIRAVKTLQRSFAQYGQFGLWNEMAGLFSADAVFIWGDDKANGARAIGDFLARKYGNGKQGLEPGAVHAQLIEQPIVDLSVDGVSAKGRWYGFLMTADGKGAASVQGGVFENVYAKQNGVWKIQTLNFLPQYEGAYETGWTNWKGQDVPITPFHFDADQAGTPVPPPAGFRAGQPRPRWTNWSGRAQTPNDENPTAQSAKVHGHYISRRMWDDATAICSLPTASMNWAASACSTAPKARARRLSARARPASAMACSTTGLSSTPLLSVALNRWSTAHVRGIELGLIGDASKKQSTWEVNIYKNRFVKEKGVWKVREMRVFPMFRSDYSQGWGKSRLGQPDGAAPDHPALGGRCGRAGPFATRRCPSIRAPEDRIAVPSGYKLGRQRAPDRHDRGAARRQACPRMAARMSEGGAQAGDSQHL